MTEPVPPPAAPAPPAPQKTPALAIVALVFACLFFVPLVPFLGSILGIIALVRKRPGQSNAVAIAAIPVGFFVGFIFTGMIAAIAIPAFLQYTKRARETEAKEYVGRIVRDLRDFHESEHVAADGSVTTGAFPVAPGQCDQAGYPPAFERMGNHYLPSADAWDAPCWKALRFLTSEPLYYDYHYKVEGNGGPGTVVMVWAEADLDTDGQIAIWYSEGAVDQDGLFSISRMPSKSDSLGGPWVDRIY